MYPDLSGEMRNLNPAGNGGVFLYIALMRFIVFIVFFGVSVVQAQPTNPSLAKELIAMFWADQEARKNGMLAEISSDSLDRITAELDNANTTRLKKIIETHGWPSNTLVGDTAAAATCYLIVHADADTAFQRMCLNLMHPLAKEGEVSLFPYAMLYDRVLVAQGKPQLYGTQCKYNEKEKAWQPFPIKDQDTVDERRKKMGHPPLREYIAAMNKQ